MRRLIGFLFCATPALLSGQHATPEMRAASSIYLRGAVSTDDATMRNAVVLVLKQAGLPGGVVTTAMNCSAYAQRPLRLPAGTSLHDALESLMSLEDARWWLDGKGVVNVLPTALPAVLSTSVERFDWNTNDSLGHSAGRLFHENIRKELEGAGWKHALQSIVRAQAAPKIGGPVATSVREGRPYSARNRTVLQILNEIVSSYEAGVWSLRLRECGENDRTYEFQVQ